MRFKYSTGFYCSHDDWDVQKQRIRNRAHIVDRDYVNDILNTLESELYKEVSRIKAEGVSVTKTFLKAKLNELTNRDISNEESEVDLFSYIEKFCARKKGKITDISLRSYRQTERLLKEFNSGLDFRDIDLVFYYDFVGFLEDDDKSLNTIGKHIKNLKVFLNAATQEGVNSNLNYKHSEFKAPKENTTAISLDEDELEVIAKLDLSHNPVLDRARDIFLMGCYTGQRVKDYNGLTNDDIVENGGIRFFKIIQQKTKNEVFCPITEEIEAIMSKSQNRNTPPQFLNEPALNKSIKEIGRRAKINQPVVKRFTKGGRQMKEEYSKYKLIGTHTARRSFCTNMYKKGMPTFDIMHFSGHTTEREFYKYIKMERQQKAVRIAKTGYFNLPSSK
jgi:integrase